MSKDRKGLGYWDLVSIIKIMPSKALIYTQKEGDRNDQTKEGEENTRACSSASAFEEGGQTT